MKDICILGYLICISQVIFVNVIVIDNVSMKWKCYFFLNMIFKNLVS